MTIFWIALFTFRTTSPCSVLIVIIVVTQSPYILQVNEVVISCKDVYEHVKLFQMDVIKIHSWGRLYKTL